MTSDQIEDHHSLFVKASPQILLNRKELKFRFSKERSSADKSGENGYSVFHQLI